MGSLFKSKKVRDEHPEALSQVKKQEAAVDSFTTSPGYLYHRGELDKINSGNYGALSSVQALNNEAAKAERANKYHFNTGAGAFNANPLLQQALRNKQQADTQENFALQIPSIIQNQANDSSSFTQNAVYNQASGYSNTAQGYQNAVKYSYKKPLFGQILGGVAPFLNFIPGVGPALAAGAGAVSGAMGGSSNPDIFGNASGGGWRAAGTNSESYGIEQPYTFGSTNRTYKQAQGELNQQNSMNLAPTTGQLTGSYKSGIDIASENPFKKFRSPFLD